jgi:hypothetical protein
LRTPFLAQFSQFSQRAARAPFEAVTETGCVGELDQLTEHLGGHPGTGQLWIFSSLIGLSQLEVDAPFERLTQERQALVA